MSPTIALCLCVLFILWLLAKDAKQRKGMSLAIWIPLIWAFSIASRPVSRWLGNGGESGEVGLEDTFIDKVVFLFLIAAGLLVLFRRRTNWRKVFRKNKWVFVYFLYLGVSVLWSDAPFVSFKRWIKDAGNIVMVLVVLSEKDPVEAVMGLFYRLAALLVPLSVLLIKYYPELSRHYGRWTYAPVTVGITTDKNNLGMGLFVCCLTLVWMLINAYESKARCKDKTAVFRYAVLLLASAWLLNKAHSSTAVACTIAGVGFILILRIPAIRGRVNQLGAYTAGVAVLVMLLQATGLSSFLLAESTELVGRDPTLHGRSEIWSAVLKEDTNPLVGVGFYSFWSEDRNRRLSESYAYILGTAHSGYIETYVNSGLIGLALLGAAIISVARKIKRGVVAGSRFETLRLTFLFTVLFYNITESIFDRLAIAWFALLVMMIEYPQRADARRHLEQPRAISEEDNPGIATQSVALRSNPTWDRQSR